MPDPMEGRGIGNYPIIGCGAKFRPWARGESLVVEFLDKHTGQWQAFMADQMPELLDAEIKKHQAAFLRVCTTMTPSEIFAAVPMTFPSVHMVDPQLLPGISRFPVEKWPANGERVLNTKGWCQLVMATAKKDFASLGMLFAVFEKQADKELKYDVSFPRL